MDTTRLSSVITGCGGKETTCSRRSSNGRSLSTKGIRIVSPGLSVRWYLPRRSTTPARACGMIRTDRTKTMMTNTIRTTSTTASAVPPAFSIKLLIPQMSGCFRAGGRRRRYRNHCCCAINGRDDHLLACGKYSRGGACAPDIAADFHQAAVRGHGLHDDGGFTDEPVYVGPLLGRALLQMRERHRPNERDHEQGYDGKDHHLKPGFGTGEVGSQGGESTATKHDEEQVKGDHLDHGKRQERREPQRPPVFPKPLEHPVSPFVTGEPRLRTRLQLSFHPSPGTGQARRAQAPAGG